MAFEAENEDGSDRIEFTVEVVDGIAADATFEASYYQADPLRRYVAAGRSVELHPYIWNGIAPTFEWNIDGQTVSTDPSFVFTPQAAGQTEISFTLSDITQSADRITRHIERRGARRGTVRFTVVCCDEPAMRPTDPSSSPHADKVFDYTPHRDSSSTTSKRAASPDKPHTSRRQPMRRRVFRPASSSRWARGADISSSVSTTASPPAQETSWPLRATRSIRRPSRG